MTEKNDKESGPRGSLGRLGDAGGDAERHGLVGRLVCDLEREGGEVAVGVHPVVLALVHREEGVGEVNVADLTNGIVK